MTAQIATIKFSCNWNGKLDNIIFCTVRKSNPIHQAGATYCLQLATDKTDKDLNRIYKSIGRGEIIDMKTMPLSVVPEHIFWIDTGFSKGETIRIFQKIHKIANEDIDRFIVDIIFIKKHKTFEK